MSGHTLASTAPRPSGWRAICDCGTEVRGHDEADAIAAFLDHAENEHLDDVFADETAEVDQ